MDRDWTSLLSEVEIANFKLLGFDFNDQIERIVTSTHQQAMQKRADGLISKAMSLPKDQQMKFFSQVDQAVDQAIK